METFKVKDIYEKDYGCEGIPEGMSRLNVVVLQSADGNIKTLELSDYQLDRGGDVRTGDTVSLGEKNMLTKFDH